MTERDKIHYEAVRRVGNGMKGACFELGAEWALGTVTRAKATGDSKLKIRFMTEAEVMEYLISTQDENNR